VNLKIAVVIAALVYRNVIFTPEKRKKEQMFTKKLFRRSKCIGFMKKKECLDE